jgi:NADH-quinone oxidoreductase subunit E
MVSTLVALPARTADREQIDRIVSEQSGRPGALLGILERVQEREPHKYLPMDTLAYVAARAGIPAARVYSVATFYSLFNLEPQGTHTISICRGTACHTRGSRALLERVKLELGVAGAADEYGADKVCLTTPDGRFTIRTVACFGQCALAPVAAMDHAVRGHMNEHALQRELEALQREHR